LLASFAKAAGAGEMLNIHDLKAAYKYCDAVTSLHATYRSSSSYTLECAFTLAMPRLMALQPNCFARPGCVPLRRVNQAEPC